MRKPSCFLILWMCSLFVATASYANTQYLHDDADLDDSVSTVISNLTSTPAPEVLQTKKPKVAASRPTITQASPARANTERTDDEEYATNYQGGQENGYVSRDNSDLLNRLTMETWKQATADRKVAKFCGGGTRSGNRSKCACAAGVADTLFATKVCTSRPYGLEAVKMHTNGIIKNICPGLGLSDKLDPWKAVGGSVIVYSGHAGKRVHSYGHIEIKIPVTAELLRVAGKAAAGAQIGGFLYCSDFCSPRPTKTATNNVVAIYNLK